MCAYGVLDGQCLEYGCECTHAVEPDFGCEGISAMGSSWKRAWREESVFESVGSRGVEIVRVMGHDAGKRI